MNRVSQFRPSARQDLIGIWIYTRDRWGLDQADAYLDKLESTVGRLALLPSVGVERSDLAPGLFKIATGLDNIYYLFDDDHLEVVRILHAKQDATTASFG